MDSWAIATADASFIDLALDELAAAAANAECTRMLAPGVALVRLDGSYWELVTGWRQNPPIFVRHINPVQETVALPVAMSAVEMLREKAVATLAKLLDPALSFSIQTRLFTQAPYRAYDVNTALADSLAAKTGASLDVRSPQQVVSVVVATGTEADEGYLGLSPAVLNLSDWAGGKRRFAREKNQISRSEFKLLEALEWFDVPLPPRGVALDLGAAPGGWTRVLRQKEQYVTAVDPAELHPSLERDPNVRHKRMTAEAYLEAEPDQFDLVVNDMRLDARDSARLMVAYAPYLYREGRGLMTLKLPEENRSNIIAHTFDILQQAYEIVSARQLFHNRSEITVYLRPRPVAQMPGSP